MMLKYPHQARSIPVCRKPRPFNLMTESLNVSRDGCGDISPLASGCLDALAVVFVSTPLMFIIVIAAAP
jgi:hypothetical protein